jgi:zinc/manganese transport system permease protein
LSVASDLYALIFQPFADFAFMRRALVACLAISVASAPIGVILILRRMSLMGDAISHAILPGVAVGFLFAGFSLWIMTLGGFVAGLIVVLLAGLVSRATVLREDASLAAFYLSSLALGVMIASISGSGIDLVHLLFGSILAVDDTGLAMVATLASFTLLGLAVAYRGLLAESFDPVFMRAVSGQGGLVHSAFLVMIVLNLVAGFQVLGTLMSVGLMMLPAAAARFWARSVWPMMAIAAAAAAGASVTGLILSYHFDLPSGPAIVLCASAFYAASILAGRENGLIWRWIRGQHVHEPG